MSARFTQKSFSLALSLLMTGLLAAAPVSDVWAAKTKKSKSTSTTTELAVPEIEKPDVAKETQPPEPEKTAEVLYNEGVELFQIAQIQAEKGNRNGQTKLLEEAIRRFDAALKKDTRMVEAKSNVGFAYLTLKDNKKAIRAFNEALAMNDKHLNTLNGLSTAYAFSGDINQAITTFERLTTLDPGNSQYFFNKGSVLQKAGRLEEARAAYQEALRINPEDQRALFNMGTLLENQGQLEEARPYYEKAKGTEIGNTIGLEAIRRIEAIDSALKASREASSAPDDKN